VLSASNAPRVNVNSINFQVHSGVVVPSSISVVSASTFPALIDTFPAYRHNSFFVVEDEVVFVDRDRRIVDVVPAGPRARFSGGAASAAVSAAATWRQSIFRGRYSRRATGVNRTWAPSG